MSSKYPKTPEELRTGKHSLERQERIKAAREHYRTNHAKYPSELIIRSDPARKLLRDIFKDMETLSRSAEEARTQEDTRLNYGL